MDRTRSDAGAPRRRPGRPAPTGITSPPGGAPDTPAQVQRARLHALRALRQAHNYLTVIYREIEAFDPQGGDPALTHLADSAADVAVLLDELIVGLQQHERHALRLVA